MKPTFPALVALLATPAFAESAREMDAHEHGVGELNIAVDGDTVAMEFHAPGADIVGFEYEAKSAEDRATIDVAVAVLAKPLDLFVFPVEAECSVTKASAGLESEEDHDEHDDHDDHAEGENHDEHGHDDHENHAEDEEHNEHGHDDHDDHAEAEASHTEFHAEYTLTCGNTDALSGIVFAYFQTFENALELEVQIITASGAQAFEVERDMPMLDLRGMF